MGFVAFFGACTYIVDLIRSPVTAKSASVINKMTPRGESGTMMTLNLSIKEESKRLPRYTTLLMDCLAMTTVAAMATAVAAAGTEAVRENGYRVVEWVVIGGSQMGHPR